MLSRVAAAGATTATAAVTVVFEAFTIQFQTSRIWTITRFNFFVFSCNLLSYFKNFQLFNILIVVFLFNFIQNLACYLSFLNCWLMSFAQRIIFIFHFTVNLTLAFRFVGSSYPLFRDSKARWAIAALALVRFILPKLRCLIPGCHITRVLFDHLAVFKILVYHSQVLSRESLSVNRLRRVGNLWPLQNWPGYFKTGIVRFHILYLWVVLSLLHVGFRLLQKALV